jgi:hypothetical protein
MTVEYQIPKNAVEAEIALAGQTPRRYRLFLSRVAQHHSGAERPGDLLNGPQDFIPARDMEDRLVLLQRDAITVATVAAEDERVTPELEREDWDSTVVATQSITLRLDDGREIGGAVRYVRPEGQRRIQDFLNDCEFFFPVRDGDEVHLVNRRRIVSVVPD